MKNKATIEPLAWGTFLFSASLFSCDDCMREYIYPKWIEIDEYIPANLKDGILLVDTNTGVIKYAILEYDAENNRYLVDLVKQEEADELHLVSP